MINIFLIILAIVWITIASVCDLRKREVPNWLNFSLIIFALAYRAFYSIINSDFLFFVYGVGGFLIFVAFGYGFYYARVFAGGDAKLLMGLGAVLPVSNLFGSLLNFGYFLFLLLFFGAIYGLLYSVFLCIRNWRKFKIEFFRQIGKYKLIFISSIILALLGAILVLFTKQYFLLSLPVLMIIFPLLYVYAKTIEESCMIVSIPAGKLTEGDWLYEKIKFRGKTIKPYWEGLSLKQVKFLKNYKGKVKVKQGIPFVPAFWLAFIGFLLLGNYNLFNLFVG